MSIGSLLRRVRSSGRATPTSNVSSATVLAPGASTPRSLGERAGDGPCILDWRSLVSGDDWVAAIPAALAECRGRTLRFPKGVYGVSAKIDMTDDVALHFDPHATLKATAAMDYVLGMPAQAYTTQHMTLRDVVVDANGLATTGVYLFKVSMSHFVAVSGLHVQNAVGTGIVVRAAQGGIFQAMRADACGGTGISIEGCNLARFYGLSAQDNAGVGIKVSKYVEGAVTYAGGVSVFGVNAERNGSHGVEIADTQSPVVMESGWLEANVGDGVRVSGWGAVLHSLRITGAGDGTTRAIHFVTGARNGVATYNYFGNEPGGDASFSAVRVESGVTNCVVSPSFGVSGVVILAPSIADGYSAPWYHANDGLHVQQFNAAKLLVRPAAGSSDNLAELRNQAGSLVARFDNEGRIWFFNDEANIYRHPTVGLKTDAKFVAVGGVGVGNSAAATTPGSVVRKMEVFAADGSSLGFVPIYGSIT